MCMMPHGAPCANVSIQMWCQKLCAAGLAQRTVQNYGYTCFLLLNSCPLLTLSWLRWWTDFFGFFFSESPAASCVQYSILYIAKA